MWFVAVCHKITKSRRDILSPLVQKLSFLVHFRTLIAIPDLIRDFPGALEGRFAPGSGETGLPGAEKGPSAPGNGKTGLPGAEKRPSAPGGGKMGLPGAEKGPSAPGGRETGCPGAKKGASAPGGGRFAGQAGE